jgi:hypothetical protein
MNVLVITSLFGIVLAQLVGKRNVFELIQFFIFILFLKLDKSTNSINFSNIDKNNRIVLFGYCYDKLFEQNAVILSMT